MITDEHHPHSESAEAVAFRLEGDIRFGLSTAEAARRLSRVWTKPSEGRTPTGVRSADPQSGARSVGRTVGGGNDGLDHDRRHGRGGSDRSRARLERCARLLARVGGGTGRYRALEAFTQSAVVVRDGNETEIPSDAVVPGDLLVVREGGRVSADGRLVEASSLEVDESALTGESLPVAKSPAPVAPDAPLAERVSMVYAGTGVTRGRCSAIVCATGTASELGQIEALTERAKPPPTPLELHLLNHLTRQMVLAGVLLTVALTSAMLLRGEPLHSAFLAGVAVAVAAVPEGLAATVTAALALGARSLARRGAIVRRLDAITTLGETTVICTDKTGTLTENKIRVAALRPASGVDEIWLLEAAVLASTARASEGGRVLGDPVEAGLILAAMERGISPDDVFGTRASIHEIPFDSDRKRMTVVYGDPQGRRAFCKGAPEILAERAADADPDLIELAGTWASEGFRCSQSQPVSSTMLRHLMTTWKTTSNCSASSPCTTRSARLQRLRYEARRAGVAVHMITGDHPATARTIGRAIGLATSEITARATPASKLALVEKLQAQGEVVAVTGDGVNDAPALRRADVGIAMGHSGTESAREAAAIVLTDDDFATIIAALREGRRIRDNIRKFVAFLLSANLGEVLVFTVAIVGGFGVPLAVVQVLLVNLVTDGLPALALGQDPASAETMCIGERHGTRLFGNRDWLALAASAC